MSTLRGVSPLGFLAGAGTREAKIGGLLFNDETSRINIGGGEDDLSTYTVPANTMKNNGDILEGLCAGQFAANTNSKTVNLYLFGQNVLSHNTSSATITLWWFMFKAVRTSATGGHAVILDGVEGGLTHIAIPNLTPTFANALVCKCTGQGVDNGDITQRWMDLKYYPANLP